MLWAATSIVDLGIAANQGHVQANYGLYLALNAPSSYEWKLLGAILAAALLMALARRNTQPLDL